MADLKTGTTIAGSLIWSKSNLDLVPTGNQLFYKESLIYSENDKPSKADVGLPAVENFGISTQAESVAGVVNDKYLTPLRNQQHFEGKTSTLTRTILGRTSASNIRGDLQLGSIATEEASNYTPVSRTLTAGNGISGGGNLTTNRTFTLGTPSTIGSGSSNTVGASTHSHAISLNSSDIPNLDTAKITSGTLSIDRIPNLAASKITSGTLSIDRIPNLAASKITSGTLSTDRLPSAALIGDTTYTSGAGLSLSGTQFNVDNTVVRNNSNQSIAGRFNLNNSLNNTVDFEGSQLKLSATGNLESSAASSISLATSTVDNYGWSLSGRRSTGSGASGFFQIRHHNADSGGVEVFTCKPEGGTLTRGRSSIISDTSTSESLLDLNGTSNDGANATLLSGSIASNTTNRYFMTFRGSNDAINWRVSTDGVLRNGDIPWARVSGVSGITHTQTIFANQFLNTASSPTFSTITTNDSGFGHITMTRSSFGTCVISPSSNSTAYSSRDALRIRAGGTSNDVSIDSDGTICGSGARIFGLIRGNTVRGSDPILKDVIEDYYLSKKDMETLNMVLFKWKATENKGELDIGILANEVEKISPLLVQYVPAEEDEENEFHRVVQYDKLAVLLSMSLINMNKNKWYKRLFRKIKGILWQ